MSSSRRSDRPADHTDTQGREMPALENTPRDEQELKEQQKGRHGSAAR